MGHSTPNYVGNERTPLLQPPVDSLPTDGLDAPSFSSENDEEARNDGNGSDTATNNPQTTSPVTVVLVLIVGISSFPLRHRFIS